MNWKRWRRRSIAAAKKNLFRNLISQQLESRRLLAADPSLSVSTTAESPVIEAGDWSDEAVVTANKGDQAIGPQGQATAVLGDGRALIVYSGKGPRDTKGIYVQPIDASGAVDGPAVRVNQTRGGLQTHAAIAAAADGTAIVVWTGRGPGDQFGIFARRIDADGNPLSDELPINQTTWGIQSHAVVTTLSNGNFVVAWAGVGRDDWFGVFSRSFDAEGNPLGEETRVNPSHSGLQGSPQVVATHDGGHAIAWSGTGANDRWGVHLRRFHADGTPASDAVRVNQTIDGLQSSPDLAVLPDGDLLVAWSGAGDGDSSGIFVRSFDDQTQPIGTAVMVNPHYQGLQFAPSIATSPDGSFLVLWNEFDTKDSDTTIRGRHFESIDSPGSPEFTLPLTTSGLQYTPSLVADDAGGYLAGWTRQQRRDEDVYVRRWIPAVKVDQDSPAVSIELASDTGSSTEDQLTSRLELRGHIDDDSAITSLQLMVTSALGSTTIEILPYLYPNTGQLAISDAQLRAALGNNLIDGPLQFHAVATDAAGNVGQSETLALALDSTPPLPPLLISVDDDTGSHHDDRITADNEPTITGTAEPGSLIELRALGASLLATATADDNGNWSVGLHSAALHSPGLHSPGQSSNDQPFTPLTDGDYRLFAIATDAAGNTSASSDPWTITIDTEPPAAPSLTFGTQVTTDTGGQLISDADWTDMVGHSEPLAAVTLSPQGLTTMADHEGRFQFPYVALDPGSNSLQLTVQDAAGNHSTSQVNIERSLPADAIVINDSPEGWISTASHRIELDPNGGTRTIRMRLDPRWATDDLGGGGDTLLVSLVDPNDPSVTLLDRGQSGTSLLALSAEHIDYAAGIVQYDGEWLSIDVSSVDGHAAGELRFQLLNHNRDAASEVTISEITTTVDPNNPAPPLPRPNIPAMPAGGPVAIDQLTRQDDVQLWIENVRIDADHDRYLAELRIRNDGPLLHPNAVIVLRDLPVTVTVTHPSGRDAAGDPYLSLANVIDPVGLDTAVVTTAVELQIDNPDRQSFPLRAEIWGKPISPEPIEFATVDDVTVAAGQVIRVPLSAVDPDGRPVSYAVVSDGPTPTMVVDAGGELVLRPTPQQAGSYTLKLIARAGEKSTAQEVTVNVTADIAAMTRISGRVLDVDGTPIAGLPVVLGRISATTNAQGEFTLALPPSLLPSEEFDIEVPRGDVYFDPYQTGRENIDFRRARYDLSTGTDADNPRRHPNLVTSFLDGSVVYGSDDARGRALRTLSGGRLKTSIGPDGELLPHNAPEFFPDGPLENDSAGPVDPASLFVAGDVRSSENPMLAALQTVLVREHNRIADEIAAADPSLDDETIYQQARRLVGALLQHITYDEFLPLLLGGDGVGPYGGYDPAVEPGVGAFFTTVAFRLGHSQAPASFELINADGTPTLGGPLSSQRASFNTRPIVDHGVDPVLRGMWGQAAEAVDLRITDPLRNMLFGPPGSGGLDLPSLSIQRARDLGLPSYNQARVEFGLPAITQFDQISSNPETVARLQAAYSNVDQIDAFVGGLAEDPVTEDPVTEDPVTEDPVVENPVAENPMAENPVAGALVGPLFHAAISSQFQRTRASDRFWYENNQLTPEQLQFVRSTTLAELLQRNSGITAMSSNPLSTIAAAPVANNAATGSIVGDPAASYRTLDGHGNSTSAVGAGATGSWLLLDTAQRYADGIAAPNGLDRPSPRAISNAALDQGQSVPSPVGVTTMAIFWGQLIAHDLSLAPTGSSDTLLFLGDEVELTGGEYPYVAEKIHASLGRDLYEGLDNSIERPIYLPKLDLGNADSVVPGVPTTVDSAAIEHLQIAIPADAATTRTGALFAGSISVTEVPRDRAPISLPDSLRPDLLMTIQPAELTFDQPVAVTMPNRGKQPPGTMMDLIAINPTTGVFEIVGQMQVSADGNRVETISGGLRTTNWFGPRPLPGISSEPNETDQEEECDPCDKSGSANSIPGTTHGRSLPRDPTPLPPMPSQSGGGLRSASGRFQGTQRLSLPMSNGAVRTNHPLEVTSSAVDPQPLRLVYDAARADPRPVVRFTAGTRGDADLVGARIRVQLGSQTIQPASERWLTQSGDAIEGTFWDATTPNAKVDLGVQIDLSEVPTGVLPWSADLGVFRATETVWSGSWQPDEVGGRIIHVNESNSPFGAGWTLSHWSRVVQTPSGDVLHVKGSGGQNLFRINSDGDFTAPAGIYDTLSLTDQGTYRLTTKTQDVYEFASDGQQLSMTDRGGNQTRFGYDSNGRLQTFTDAARLVTRFVYDPTGERVTEIIADDGRVTRLQHHSGGFLSEITDPDAARRAFQSNTRGVITREIDELGRSEQILLGPEGRGTGWIDKQGAITRLQTTENQQVRQLRGGAARVYQPSVDTPPSATVARPPIAETIDPNGRVQRYELDRMGIVRDGNDALGSLPGQQRNDQMQVHQTVDAAGNVTFYQYDDRGNVISIADAMTGGQRVDTRIEIPGQQLQYHFTISATTALWFTALTADPMLTWSLDGPLGLLVDQQSFAAAVHGPPPNAVTVTPGEYRLTVDGVDDFTGDVAFRLSDLAAAALMPLGVTVEAQLQGAGDTQIYQFDGQLGQEYSLDLSAAPLGSEVRLIDPRGRDANSFGLGFLPFTAEQNGPYRLIVRGSGDSATSQSVPLTLHAVDPVVDPDPGTTPAPPVPNEQVVVLTPGTTVSGEIPGPDHWIIHTFELAESTEVSIDNRTTAGVSSWRLMDESDQVLRNELVFADAIGGGPLLGGGIGISSSNLVIGPAPPVTQAGFAGVIERVPAGRYRIVVEGDHSDYRLAVTDLRTADSLPNPGNTSLQIDPNQLGLYRRLDLRENQQLRIQFSDTALLSSAATATLLNPAGKVATTFAIDANPQRIPITVSGRYTLVISDAADLVASPVTIGVTVNQVTDELFDVPVGSLQRGTIDHNGDRHSYRFDAAAGQMILVQNLITETDAADLRLLAPSSALLSGSDDPASGHSFGNPTVLRHAGVYQLRAGGDDSVGEYRFRVTDLSAAATLAAEGTASGRLTIDNAVIGYRVAAQRGERWQLQTESSNTIQLRTRIFSASGILRAESTTGITEFTANQSADYFVIVDASSPAIELPVELTVTASLQSPAIESDESFTAPLAGTIAAGQSAQHSIDAVAGMPVRLSRPVWDDAALQLTWITPSGDVLGDDTVFTFPESGRYTLKVQGKTDQDTAGYVLQLNRLDRLPIETIQGERVSGVLEAGNANLHPLQLAAGQTIAFDGSVAGAGARVRVYDPDLDITHQFTGDDDALMTAAVDGRYLVEVSAGVDASTSYSYRLLDLGDATTIRVDEAIRVEPLDEHDLQLWQFTAQAGQRLYVDGDRSQHETMKIFDPFMNPVLDHDASEFGGLGDHEIQLTSSGTYTLWIDGDRLHRRGFSLSVHLSDPTESVPINPTANGAPIQIQYDSVFNVPIEVTDAAGRRTVHELDEATGNTLTSIQIVGLDDRTSTETDDLVTSYTYTTLNRIDTVTDPLGRITDFDYDSRGQVQRATFAQGLAEQTSTEFEYDAAGNLIAVVDGRGHRTQYQYDAAGRVTMRRDATGGKVHYRYDARGNLQSFTDERGGVWHYRYDELDRLTTITDPLNQSERYEYDDVGNLITSTDRLGRPTRYQYDERNRQSAMITADGGVTKTDHDDNGNVTARTDPLGRVSSYHYDARNQQIAMIDPAGNRTRYHYDAVGNLIVASDALGRITRTTYDELNRPVRVDFQGPQGPLETTTFGYDPIGNLIQIIDPLQRVTNQQYDALDRMVQQTRAAGTSDAATTSYQYDAADNQVAMVDPRGNRHQYEYDALNRLVVDQDALGHAMTFQFDAASNLIEFSDRRGHVTSFRYDALNRPTTTIDALGHAKTVQYDAVSNAVVTTDALGRQSRFEHDVMDRLRRTSDPVGNVTHLSYDLAGNVTTVIDGLGHATTTRYDQLDRAVSVVDALGNETSSRYDAVGNRIEVTDPLGRTTQLRYDDRDRLIEQTVIAEELDTHITRWQYDSVGNLVAQIDALGRTTQNLYDALDRPVMVTRAAGSDDESTMRYQYDASGNRVATINPLGNRTEYQFDAVNQLTTELDARGQTTRYEWDPAGNLNSVTDRLIHRTQFQYDPLNRQSNVRDALGNVWQTTFDAVGNVTSQVDPLGHQENFQYDAGDRLVTQTDPVGNQTTYQYDTLGKVVAITDPHGHVTRYQYDPLQRLQSEIDATGQMTTYVYDAAGNRTHQIDRLGRTLQWDHDGLDRVVRQQWFTSVDQGGPGPVGETPTTTDYVYDAVGNLISLTDGLGNTTAWTYDDLDRPVSMSDPTGQTATTGYDALGQRTQTRDRDGRVTRYQYDELQRLVREVWVDGMQPYGGSGDVVIASTYDAEGNRTSVVDPFASLTFAYDPLHRVVTESNVESPDTPAVQLDFQYDVVGNRTVVAETIDGAAAAVTRTQFDAANRPLALIQQDAATAPGSTFGKRVQFGYDVSGRVERIERFSGIEAADPVIQSQSSYDTLDRLQQMQHRDANGAELAVYTMDYDQADRLTRIVDSQGVVDYRYDGRDQVIAAEYSDNRTDEAYEFDQNGNRLSSTQHGSDYQTAAGNRVTSDGRYQYQYDASGARIRQIDVVTGSERHFDWDHRGRLIASTDVDVDGVTIQSVQYRYDSLDRRIRRSVDADGDGPLAAVDETFVYDGQDVLLDFVDDRLAARYLHGPAVDQVLAQESFAAGVTADPEQLQWHLHDQLGSTRTIVDAGGAVINEITLDAFGGVVDQSNANESTRYQFTGREYDAATGLYHFRARSYDPSLGRFLSEDPLGFAAGDVNLSRYVGNGVVNGRDPSGKVIVVVHGINNFNRREVKNITPKLGQAGRERQEIVHFVYGRDSGDPNEPLFPNAGDAVLNTYSTLNREAGKALAATVNQLRSSMNHAGIMEPIHVAGYSNGGNVVVEMAQHLDQPVDNVLLLGTSFPRGKSLATLAAQAEQVHVFSSPSDLATSIVGGLGNRGINDDDAETRNIHQHWIRDVRHSIGEAQTHANATGLLEEQSNASRVPGRTTGISYAMKNLSRFFMNGQFASEQDRDWPYSDSIAGTANVTSWLTDYMVDNFYNELLNLEPHETNAFSNSGSLWNNRFNPCDNTPVEVTFSFDVGL